MWVEALAAIEEFWQEGRVECLEIHGRHVVEGQRDVFLQEIVTLVQKDLQENVREVKEHGTSKQLPVIQLVFAVQNLQVAQVLFEDVNIWLQEGLTKRLHSSGELRLVLHEFLGSGSLDAAQHRSLEEEPPVLMKNLEKKLKQLSFYIWTGTLCNYWVNLIQAKAENAG